MKMFRYNAPTSMFPGRKRSIHSNSRQRRPEPKVKELGPPLETVGLYVACMCITTLIVFPSLFQKDLYKAIMMEVLHGKDLIEELKEEYGTEKGGEIRQRLHNVSSFITCRCSTVNAPSPFQGWVKKVKDTQFWEENTQPRVFARRYNELNLPVPEAKKAAMVGQGKPIRLRGGKGMSDPSSTSSDDDGNWKRPTSTSPQREGEHQGEDVSLGLGISARNAGL